MLLSRIYYLKDYPLTNTSLTWKNGQEPTMSRLDRFLVTNCWEDLHPHFVQETLPPLSDLKTCGHCTLLSKSIKVWWDECEVHG